ncbi:MAG TPA: thermonuclease family protein [Blastocatellia bacterium]|nr:thermonuclease family protein [Blastocatellia bacterium]
MLSFKQETETETYPERWAIGVDRKHVAVYVSLALIAGFALGFALARVILLKQNPAPTVVSASQTPQRTAGANTDAAPAAQAAPGEYHRVTRIVRADTFEVEGVGTVRLIGIETLDAKQPQNAYGAQGQKALKFAEETLLGQDVRIEFDPANAARGNRDEQGNTLAYVYTRDGTLINGELIKQGLAFVRSDEQFQMSESFRSYEREAMQAARGVWGSSTPAQAGQTTPADRSKLSALPPDAIGPNIPATTTSPVAPMERMVYVSQDKKYHKEASCELMDKRGQRLPESQAKAQGYTPCSRCYPSNTIKVR